MVSQAKCMWCCKDFKFDTMGISALRQHSKGESHRKVADGRKRRIQGQRNLVSSSVADNNNVQDAEDNRNIVMQGVSAPVRLHNTPMNLDDKVLKAELLLILKGVESQYCNNSYNNLVPVLQKLDPDSNVLQKMSLKRSKVSYIVSHGLSNHFQK